MGEVPLYTDLLEVDDNGEAPATFASKCRVLAAVIGRRPSDVHGFTRG